MISKSFLSLGHDKQVHLESKRSCKSLSIGVQERDLVLVRHQRSGSIIKNPPAVYCLSTESLWLFHSLSRPCLRQPTFFLKGAGLWVTSVFTHGTGTEWAAGEFPPSTPLFIYLGSSPHSLVSQTQHSTKYQCVTVQHNAIVLPAGRNHIAASVNSSYASNYIYT